MENGFFPASMGLTIMHGLFRWQLYFAVKVYGCIWRSHFLAATDDNYDLVCLKKDEALGLITLVCGTQSCPSHKQQKCKAGLGFLPHPIWCSEHHSNQ
jgi:hypothetical protein